MIRKLLGKKGQSLVEFALVLPILILLLCAILDFGWLIGNRMLATYGCREGARYGAVRVTSADFNDVVETKVLDAMPEFTHEGLDITVVRTNLSSPREGDVIVSVDYSFRLLTPFAMIFFGEQEYTAEAECIMKAE
jgi:Flp pilus assembly protein TadG